MAPTVYCNLNFHIKTRKESVHTEQSALIQMICVPDFQLQKRFPISDDLSRDLDFKVFNVSLLIAFFTDE